MSVILYYIHVHLAILYITHNKQIKAERMNNKSQKPLCGDNIITIHGARGQSRETVSW